MHILYRFRSLPIFYKILSFFAILILLSILLVFFNYLVYSHQNEEAAYRSTASGASQAANEIQTYLEDLKSASLIPLSRQYEDYNLPSLLVDADDTRKLMRQTESTLLSLTGDILGFKKSIHSVIFCTSGGWYYARFQRQGMADHFDPLQQPWFDEMLQSSGEVHYLAPFSLACTRDLQTEEQMVFSVARAIVDIPDAKVVGMLLINTDLSFFDAMSRRIRLYDDQRVVVLDTNDRIIYDSQIQRFGETASDELLSLMQTGRGKVDSRQYMSAVSQIGESGWRLVNLAPLSGINQGLRWMSIVTTILMTFIIVISILIARAMALQISVPLKRLVQNMQLAQTGDLSTRVQVNRTDEIGTLSQAFNSMLDEINRLINVVYADKLTQKELELSMLQSQINPHFLYNTLESISMMAEVNDDSTAAQMASSLGRILRYSLNNDGPIVTLGEELYVLRQYILLQQERLSHQFRIEEQIHPSLYEYPILRLTLQPIVENAVYHGMKAIKSNGLITITGEKQTHSINIYVSDNGKGMTEDHLAKLRDFITEKTDAFDSIGLRNVNRRLKLYFGDAYGLDIQSTVGSGTIVTIKIPRNLP